MRIALTAAETWHLVLATTHTHGGVKAVEPAASFFEDGERGWARGILGAVLNCIFAQLRVPSTEGLRVLADGPLVNTPAVRQHIVDNRVSHISKLSSRGQQDGKILIQQALARQAREGLITRGAGEYAAEGPETLDRALAG